MDSQNVAVVLVVLGVVGVLAPLYLGPAGGSTDEVTRTDFVYAAEPLNGSDPAERQTIIDRYGDGVLLSVHEVSEQRSPDVYRAPSKTRQLLRFAMANDHGTTDDPAVQADLRQIEAEYTFAHDANDEDGGYYEVFVRSNGTVVQMEPAAEDRVLEATLQSTVVEYENLSRTEKRTFDRIREESVGATDSPGYRPRAGNELLDRLPTIVLYEDVLYDVRRVERVAGGGQSSDDSALVDPTIVRLAGALLMAGGFSLFLAGERNREE
jgi:hypothetical protein